MSQSEQFGEAWAHVRDHERPVRPDDVWFLREARADMPPSKAHLKRLAKPRPEIVRAKVLPEPDRSRRREINQAAAHGSAIAALLGYRKPIVR